MYQILIIGNGGREHAIAWKIAQDNRVKKIFIAPGNAGSEYLDNCENVNLKTIDEMLDFALKNQIDLTIVGPEVYLVEGIVDKFKRANLTIFGPDKQAAMLEGSKAYSKEFMQKYGVKTAAYQTFSDATLAQSYLNSCAYPVVVKASGIAAGKGVIICQNHHEASTAVDELMLEDRFGDAGKEIVIEEFLDGFEVSILSFCDGKNILPMLSAKDHKTIGDHNTGENTGGMGVIAPHPSFTEAQYQLFIDNILTPTITGMKAEQMSFAGIVFFGLMVNAKGVYLLEYNMRFGDPETQAILPLLKNNLLDLMLAAIDKRISAQSLEWEDKVSLCLVAASQGYPRDYQTHIPIYHIEKARFFCQVFLAGAIFENENLVTHGGRVLNVIGIGNDLASARKVAYSSMNLIEFSGKTIRNDIGESR